MVVRIPAKVTMTLNGDGFIASCGYFNSRGPFVSRRIAQAHVDRWNRAHPPTRRCPTCHGTETVLAIAQVFEEALQKIMRRETSDDPEGIAELALAEANRMIEAM